MAGEVLDGHHAGMAKWIMTGQEAPEIMPGGGDRGGGCRRPRQPWRQPGVTQMKGASLCLSPGRITPPDTVYRNAGDQPQRNQAGRPAACDRRPVVRSWRAHGAVSIRTLTEGCDTDADTVGRSTALGFISPCALSISGRPHRMNATPPGANQTYEPDQVDRCVLRSALPCFGSGTADQCPAR